MEDKETYLKAEKKQLEDLEKDEWQDIEKAEVKDAKESVPQNKEVMEFNETLKFNIQILRKDYENHNHCIKCLKPMQISELTRDGVCLICKEKTKITGPRIV